MLDDAARPRAVPSGLLSHARIGLLRPGRLARGGGLGGGLGVGGGGLGGGVGGGLGGAAARAGSVGRRRARLGSAAGSAARRRGSVGGLGGSALGSCARRQVRRARQRARRVGHRRLARRLGDGHGRSASAGRAAARDPIASSISPTVFVELASGRRRPCERRSAATRRRRKITDCPVRSSRPITTKRRSARSSKGQFSFRPIGISTMKKPRTITWNQKQPRPGPRSGSSSSPR